MSTKLNVGGKFCFRIRNGEIFKLKSLCTKSLEKVHVKLDLYCGIVGCQGYGSMFEISFKPNLSLYIDSLSNES